MAKKKLTKKQITSLQSALQEERQELLDQAAGLEAEADITQWRDAGFDDDPGDSGSAAFERERAQSLAMHARRILGQIDDALHKIEQGTYGACERCGKPIGYERLDAIPYASLCMECKQLTEHGR